MADLEWVTEPPLAKGSHLNWGAIFRRLKNRKMKWAAIHHEEKPRKATMKAHYLKTKCKHVPNIEHFEIITRNGVIFARYVGAQKGEVS